MADVTALAHSDGDRVTRDLDLARLVVADFQALSGKAARSVPGRHGKALQTVQPPAHSKSLGSPAYANELESCPRVETI